MSSSLPNIHEPGMGDKGEISGSSGDPDPSDPDPSLGGGGERSRSPVAEARAAPRPVESRGTSLSCENRVDYDEPIRQEPGPARAPGNGAPHHRAAVVSVAVLDAAHPAPHGGP